MGKSKVYFTDRQARPDYNMIDKLEHVFKELGLEHVFKELGLNEEIKSGEKIMVKTHFGQWVKLSVEHVSLLWFMLAKILKPVRFLNSRNVNSRMLRRWDWGAESMSW
ncbi:MAG: hypothetical protein ACXABV_12705 [Candidatus Thorarchaeota archaeon]|jgi:hypothetical protein